MINYVQNEREDHDITTKIIACQFDEELKCIFQGAGVRKYLSPEEWKQRCQDLLLTYFSRDGKHSGIITFPETNFAAQGKPWQNVMRTLKKWCKISNSVNFKPKDDATGIIIRNYDLKNHLDFCKVTDESKKNCLPFLLKYPEGKFKFNENKQRFLVFNPSEKIILVIRMVDAQQRGELKNEAHLCIDEVNIVCLLLRYELKDSGVIVAGLVTYLGEDAHSESCTDCGNYIVSCKIFSSVEKFVSFWRSFVKKNISELLGKYLNARGNIDTTKVFEAVGGKILGYLAHLQFETLEEPVLPVKENNPSGNIKQAELLLDRYQMEIAYSDEKRILLSGNYGTGKTVVALKKLELLYKCLKEKEVIYYINFAGKSRLDCMVKQKFKKYEKVRVLRGGASLSQIIHKEIMPKEDKNDTKNIHLIVDEYNSQSLTPEESELLYQMFTKLEQFENSTLFIALQPIKIDRCNFFTIAGKRQKLLHKQHALETLKPIMTEYKLKYFMRTTIQINALAEITQYYLSEKSDQYKCSHESNKISSSYSKILKRKSESSPDGSRKRVRLSPNSSLFSSPPSNIISDNSFDSSNPGLEILSVDMQERIDDDKLISGEIIPETSSHKLLSVVSSSPSIASVIPSASAPSQSSSSTMIDFDEPCKSASTPSNRGEKNLSKTVTKYSYTRDSKIGHNIDGPLPILIEFQKTYNYKRILVLIVFFLKKIIHIESKSIAILHFESPNAFWLYQLLQLESYFENLTLTNDVEEFLASRSDKNMVLVNSYNVAKGLEFSGILLILEKDEYYLKQYIPEAITRCTSNLSVLIRPSWKKKNRNQSNTVKNLVDYWKERNLDKKNCILKLLTLGFCSNRSCVKFNEKSTSCPDIEGSSELPSFYGVHTHTKWCKGLFEEIVRKIGPVEQLNDKTKEEEEATAL